MSRARIRTLKPEFFQDEKVNAVSRDARFLTIGLITHADDRGRQQNMEQAILGHVYPKGDVQVKQLGRWLGEIVDIGIAWAYDHGPFSYLWLPHFWRHQRINRPSESDLPAHPSDRYAHLPINEAITAYNSERIHEPFNESISEPLIPSRAGVRSAPVPFAGGEKQTTTETAESDTRAQAQDLFAYWQDRCGHPTSKLSPERRGKIVARLREGATEGEIREAIDGAARAAHTSDTGQRFDDIELICRNRTKLESFIRRASLRPVGDENSDRRKRRTAALSNLMASTEPAA